MPLNRPSSRRIPACGFTVTELLVVIAVIALVVAVLLPSIASLRAGARSTKDLSQQRQIAQAHIAYAGDQAGYHVSPRTDLANDLVPHAWVGNPEAQTDDSVETEAELSAGALWTYLNANASAYKSPLDATGRIRSYSLNAYVGVVVPDDPVAGSPVQLPPGAVNLDSRTLSKIPRPAETLCSIGEARHPSAADAEDAKTLDNVSGWLVDWRTPLWFDTPALWNGNLVNFSTLDGAVRSIPIVGESFRRQVEDEGSQDLSEEIVNDTCGWFSIQGNLLPGRLPTLGDLGF